MTSFSCTRLQAATQQDYKKLERVLSYLLGTVEHRTEVSACSVLPHSGSNVHVSSYVDAAHALHQDSKAHTGVLVYVGNILAYVSSCKLKCMTKSPTETVLLG